MLPAMTERRKIAKKAIQKAAGSFVHRWRTRTLNPDAKENRFAGAPASLSAFCERSKFAKRHGLRQPPAALAHIIKRSDQTATQSTQPATGPLDKTGTYTAETGRNAEKLPGTGLVYHVARHFSHSRPLKQSSRTRNFEQNAAEWHYRIMSQVGHYLVRCGLNRILAATLHSNSHSRRPSRLIAASPRGS